MSNVEMQEYATREQLDSALANAVAQALSSAIQERGRAVLVVSGGSTPVHFFRLLSNAELRWQHVTVTLADERWVDRDHKDSNEKLVRESLLINQAGSAHFLSLKSEHANAVDAQSELDTELERLGTIDVLILGMGLDGHTASLFPGSQALSEGLELTSGKSCIAVQPSDAPHQRMSMTLPRLLDARQILVHLTGAEKRAVFDEAKSTEEHARLPISAVLQHSMVPVTLYWAP